MSRKKVVHVKVKVGALIVASAFGNAWAEPVEKSEIAQQSSAQSAPIQLESVTITARRRTEKAQDVPTSSSTVSGEQLEAQGIYQVQDLQQALPSVTTQFLHARQSSIAVRGIGNNVANEGLEGSVGIYLDNVYLGRPGQAVFDLLDLEQIDLLRGPQGTLFGKNTTAGVLNISTRAPTFEKEGYLETSAGNRGYQQYKAGYSGPINDVAAFRISAYSTHDDGWVSNTNNDRKYNEINREGIRGQLLLKPSADFSLRLIAEHNEENSSTGTLVPYSYGPLNKGTATNTASNATRYDIYARGLGAQNIVTNPYDYQVSINDNQNVNVKQNALSAEANWKVGEYQLTSVTAWRDWKFDPKNDLDGTSLSGFTGGFTASEEQFSQELRLASPIGKDYDYVVGGYYYHQSSSSYNHYESGASALQLATLPNNSLLSGNGAVKTDSYAIFGQGTLHLTQKFDLTGGLRATTEKKEGHITQNAATNLAAAPAAVQTNALFNYWDSGTLSRVDNSLSSLLTGSYKLTDQALGYTTVSHGQKSGGFNVNSVTSVGSALGTDAVNVKPERATNFEAGLKTAWFDNRLIANGNLFLTKIVDYQAVTAQTVGNNYIAVLTNVGNVTSKGFEFDFKALPTRNLTLNLNGAYTIAKFDSGTGPTPFETFNDVGNPSNTGLQGYGKGSRSIAGNYVNGAPKWIVNVGGQYRFNLRDNIDQYVNANYAWRASSYGDINNSIYSVIPSYGVLNLSTGWRVKQSDGGWDLSIWARNVLDKKYFLGLTALGNNAYVASAGQPRTVGVSLRYDFF